MKEITTKSGFTAHLQEDPADNWEILKLLRDYSAGQGYALVNIAERLLGREGLAALEAHLKERGGQVRVSAMEAEILSIFQAEAKTKNS